MSMLYNVNNHKRVRFRRCRSLLRFGNVRLRTGTVDSPDLLDRYRGAVFVIFSRLRGSQHSPDEGLSGTWRHLVAIVHDPRSMRRSKVVRSRIGDTGVPGRNPPSTIARSGKTSLISSHVRNGGDPERFRLVPDRGSPRKIRNLLR